MTVLDSAFRTDEYGRIYIKWDSAGNWRNVFAPGEVLSTSRTTGKQTRERRGDRVDVRAEAATESGGTRVVRDTEGVLRQSEKFHSKFRAVQRASGPVVGGQDRLTPRFALTEEESGRESVAWSFRGEGWNREPYDWLWTGGERLHQLIVREIDPAGVVSGSVDAERSREYDTYRDGALYQEERTGGSLVLRTRQSPGGPEEEVYRREREWNQTIDHRGLLERIGATIASIVNAPLADWSNFFAGWADGLSFGLTQKVRGALQYDDVVDKSSGQYGWGSTVGMVHSLVIGLGSGRLASAYNSFGMRAVAEHGLENGIGSLANGDILGALKGFGEAAGGLFFRSDICNWSSGLARNGVRGLELTAGALHGFDAIQNFANGDVMGGFTSLAQGLFLTAQRSRACFVAGTPLRTGDGSKAIETFKSYEEFGDKCDYVLSRNEFDPNGPLELKRVLRKFVRVSPILNLHVGGQIIGTTGEHPFYVQEKGWLPAGALAIGDLLQTSDGNWMPVEGVADSGQVETVYNLEVEGHHTYFVGL